MGTYIPGMNEHNAVNNDDGFTTGFLGNKHNSTPPGPPQNFLTNTQQIPTQNTQQMPMQNTQQMSNPMMNQGMPSQPMMPQAPNPSLMKTKGIPEPPKGMMKQNMQQMTGAVTMEEKANIASKVIHIISIVIMISLIAFIALYLSGKIDLHKKKDEPVGDPEPVVDLEKEKIEKILVKLNSACNNLDDEGNYGEPTVQGEEECSDLTCFINENVMCQGKLCMIAVEDKVYTRDCATGSNKVADKNAFQASVNLGDLCNTIMKNPDLNGSIQASYGTCVYFECVTDVGGQLYEKSCREDS